MKLISWNVNGLRAALDKGFLESFRALDADVFCLQETKVQPGQVELDPSGYIVADETTRTSVPGVFAVGDARTKAVRQIVTAVADGAVAAHYAEEFLLEDAVKDKNLS